MPSRAVDQADVMESRRHALQDCLARLRSTDREIIRACYGDTRTTIKDAAETLGRPANTVYKATARIRRALHACISRRLASESRP